MLRLSLVRHAVTLWNTEGRVQGQSDVPLSALGEAQAGALRARFAGEEVALYSSPLSRARTTAALAFPGQTSSIDARLSELNFGSFEGLTLSERQVLPEWHAWTRDPFLDAAPGGESYGELYRRAQAWLGSLPNTASKTVPNASHVVAVTHSGTIQTLVAYLLQMETKGWRKRIYLEHTGVTSFVWNGSELLLERLNDTQHLTPELRTLRPVAEAFSQGGAA